MQSTVQSEETGAAWRQLAPMLDDAMADLGERDRAAVVLRYFENRPWQEVASLLQVTEDAAQKRVTRALDKLRKLFARRGVALTTALIASSVASNSVQAAPAAALKATLAVAATKGAAATTSTLVLAKGAMKMMTWTKCKYAVAISAVLLMTGGLVTVALSGEKAQQVPADAVSFFKQAIGSPPDIDSFVVGQRSLKPLEDLVQLAQLVAQRPGAEITPNPQENLQKAKEMQLEKFYAGARAGADYYLRYISSPSTPNIPAENLSIIIGRAGSVLYQVGRNNVSYGSGTNAFVANVNALFGLVRQFLDMGLGDVEPESVVWTGNQFTARNRFGKTRYGELEVSNNLPNVLMVSEQKNSPAFTMVQYHYPNPPASLGGFPAKMTIFDVSKGEYKPNLEITLYSIHVADRRLPQGFFSDDQFKTAQIIYTNAYINSEVWGTVKPLKGKPYFTNISNMKVVYPKAQKNPK